LNSGVLSVGLAAAALQPDLHFAVLVEYRVGHGAPAGRTCPAQVELIPGSPGQWLIQPTQCGQMVQVVSSRAESQNKWSSVVRQATSILPLAAWRR
jgi:hypothetical protein